MLMIEPAVSVRFSDGRFDCATSRRLSHSGWLFVPRNQSQRLAGGSHMRRNTLIKSRVRASTEEQSGASSNPIKQNSKPSRYHPFEDIVESQYLEGGEARLTPAETSRTIIEVNSKATLMFSGFVSDGVHDNIFWPDLPYVTDEYGNVYFHVKNDEDILRSLATEDNFVQVLVGLDTAELLSEMVVSGSSEIDFGVEEIDDEDSDIEDEDDEDDENDEDEDYDNDWVSILEDEEDQEDSDESLGDWAKLDTMSSSHPMYFAKKMAEVASDDSIDYMDQPPAGLAIQGLLRPAFIEEHSFIQKHVPESNHKSGNAKPNQVGVNVEDKVEDLGIINAPRQGPGSSQDSSVREEELEKGESLGNGTSFYKLEMIKIQLISAHGNQTVVDIEDFRNAQPDAIAHSAANIISRLKASGEKTMQALKSLCWRCKGIQVEEATVIGVDTLGFDLRICTGKQIQTLRYTFNTRASSEYSAERQLNDLLFPRTHQKLQKQKEAHHKEP